MTELPKWPHSISFKSQKWMHTSDSSFLESFFLGFISGYFTFRHCLQCTTNITFAALQEQCANTTLWEKMYNSLSGMHTSQRSFSESFSPVFTWRYFLFPHRPECAPECPFTYPSMMQFQNCVIKRKSYLCEKNRHIYHTAFSQKSYFQFFSDDISFFTTGPKMIPNIPSQIRPWQSFQTV